MSARDGAGPTKAVLVSAMPGSALTRHVAGLALPKRALSLPVAPDPPPALPSFVELWGETAALRAEVAAWPGPARAWLVAESVPIAYERTWPSGAPSPGLRMVSTVHRRPDLDREAFEAHWRGPHTEVALRYTVPFWRYVQDVVREPIGRDAEEVDGFAGMHFRTAEDLRARWQDHPEEAARGAADAARFMDVDRSVAVTMVETVWDDAPDAGERRA